MGTESNSCFHRVLVFTLGLGESLSKNAVRIEEEKRMSLFVVLGNGYILEGIIQRNLNFFSSEFQHFGGLENLGCKGGSWKILALRVLNFGFLKLLI